jgi:hypothetical protein
MKAIRKIEEYRAVGKKEISTRSFLTTITKDIEHIVGLLKLGETDIQAIINVKETTPYIDASILSDWIIKAAKIKGKTLRQVSVDLDNTQEEYSFEIHAKKEVF